LIFTTPEQVKSSVRKNSSAPVWNERLILPGLFPPMCQRFKIELLHGDTKRAVRFLNLRSISDDKEEGFLPTFGPDFVHFYSPNHLEGYLGKILLSLQTTLLEDLTEYEAKAHLEGQDAPPLDEIMFPQCEDVVLFATIFEASSISRRFSDKPISFRMSCGPLHVDEGGDKVEATVTPPLKPQIMNKNYCFVPIDEEKPCLHLTLSLPDVRKRMFNYNLLTKMLTSLKTRLDKIEDVFENKDYNIASTQTEALLLETLDFIASAAGKYIDIASTYNFEQSPMLDYQRLKLALREMETIQLLSKIISSNQLSKKKIFQKITKLYARIEALIDDVTRVFCF
jgi:hypothetical protein